MASDATEHEAYPGRAMVWGRWIFAVGGNPDAARLAAIPVNAVVVSVYVISGLAAGIAAVVNAGRIASLIVGGDG